MSNPDLNRFMIADWYSEIQHAWYFLRPLLFTHQHHHMLHVGYNMPMCADIVRKELEGWLQDIVDCEKARLNWSAG